MDKIIMFDDFALNCEYFEWGCEEEGTNNINNGYLCNHPEQGERQIMHPNYRHKKPILKETIGECHSYSCPFGHPAEPEDFIDKNIDNNGYDKKDDNLFVLYKI